MMSLFLHHDSWMRQWLRPTYWKKFLFFFVGDAILVFFSLYISFALRFDFVIEENYLQILFFSAPIFLIVKFLCFSYFRLYRVSWRFVSLKDFYNIAKAIMISSAALAIIVYASRIPSFAGFPRSVFILDAVMTFLFVAALRIAKRFFFEVFRGIHQKGKRTLIIGAGNTGEMILRDLQKTNAEQYLPVAFLDDDPNRCNTYLHGVKVMGRVDDFTSAIRLSQATAVIIAIPSLGHIRLREVYKRAKEEGVSEIKIVPRIYDVQRPQLRARELEDIKIEDLIGRQAVSIDYQEIGRSIEDKTVCVTGAGGSIGFEIVSQLCVFRPRRLVLFEIDETELHHAEIRLKREFPEMAGRLHFIIGDIRDRERVEQTFATHKPDLVFHAAAYKHVPMMEYNVSEAVKVNVFGAYHLAEISLQWGVERFVMISTDKAVRPTSVMGATKRVAEYICQSFNARGKTEFISVRFGNVLGSRGSVLPLFLEQIEKGEALTITHEDMQRYFMTIPEAVSLVLQAGVIGRGGDVLVLDMGSPVKIVELAEELLRLHGLEPYKDIDIQYIGIRPGEKLFEEMLTAEEGTVSTRHEKIFIAKVAEHYSLEQIHDQLERLKKTIAVSDGEGKEVKALLKQWVRWYTHETSVSHTAQREATSLVSHQHNVFEREEK